MARKRKKPRKKGEGSIYKRRNNKWEGRLLVGKTSQGKKIFYSVCGSTSEEAEQKLAELKRMYSGAFLTEKSLVTVSEWMKMWLELYKKPLLAPSTYSNYESLIKNHIEQCIGSKRIYLVRTKDIQRMVDVWTVKKAVRGNKKLSKASVTELFLLTGQIFEDAVRENIIPLNPCIGVICPSKKREPKEMPREEDIRKFIDKIRELYPQWYDLFYMELMTGLRRGEICGLKWIDFNGKTRELTIRRSVRYATGGYESKEPKTNAGKRTIIVPMSVSKMLVERKKKIKSEWIFPSEQCPENPVNPMLISHKLTRALREAGVPHIRFHDLRHLFSTQASFSGVEPDVLATIMGHRYTVYSLDTYAHNTIDILKRAKSIIEKIVFDVVGEE